MSNGTSTRSARGPNIVAVSVNATFLGSKATAFGQVTIRDTANFAQAECSCIGTIQITRRCDIDIFCLRVSEGLPS